MSDCRHGHADWQPEGSNRLLRAAHVVGGVEPAGGGPSYSVPRLCEGLAAAGAETMLLSVTSDICGDRDTYDKGYRDRRFSWDYARIPVLRRLRSSQALSRALRHTALTADVIHNHGLWLMPNIGAGVVAAGARVPLV